MLIVKKFIFSPFSENTYVVFDETSLEAMIIDPGNYDENENKTLSGFIDENRLVLKYIVNTHCHIDHIFGNAFLKEKYGVKYLAPEHDVFLLDLMMEQSKTYGVNFKPSPQPDEMLNEYSTLRIGYSTCSFLYTPGHTQGELCIYFETDKICFTGDVLFKEGIGRTDLWGGNFDDLIKSIKTKLFNLPDDVIIYPGHEAESTIGHEKLFNPFLTS
ncbi:MAG: MBL fold metallo-hydrolase [Ignavibacteria bacterium]|nr:MBL fold metallo-hydrolase [Ignavibacteria bacterium]